MKIESNPSTAGNTQSTMNEIITGSKNQAQNTSKFLNDKASILNQKELNEALDNLNETVETYHKQLRFEYHEKAERMMVMVVDMATQEVIKEIPPEKIMEMVAKIKEMVGIIIDETI